MKTTDNDHHSKISKLTKLPAELRVTAWRPIRLAQIKRATGSKHEIAYALRADSVALDEPRHWPSATLAIVELSRSTTSTRVLPARDTDIKHVLLAIRKYKQHRYVVHSEIDRTDIDRIARRARIKPSELAHAVVLQVHVPFCVSGRPSLYVRR